LAGTWGVAGASDSFLPDVAVAAPSAIFVPLQTGGGVVPLRATHAGWFRHRLLQPARIRRRTVLPRHAVGAGRASTCFKKKKGWGGGV
jgi:hypothetical protein